MMEMCDVCGRSVDYLTSEYDDVKCNRCKEIENIQCVLDLRLCSFTDFCEKCGKHNAVYHFEDPTRYLCPKCARSFVECVF